MTTIKERCRGRLVAVPPLGMATNDERITIMTGNLAIMREEIGSVPHFYPQSEAEVPGWLEESDRIIGRLAAVISGLAKLPADTLVPSPFGLEDRQCGFCGPGWSSAHKHGCPRAAEDYRPGLAEG